MRRRETSPCDGRAEENNAGCGKHENAHMSATDTSVVSFLQILCCVRYLCQKRLQQCHLGKKNSIFLYILPSLQIYGSLLLKLF